MSGIFDLSKTAASNTSIGGASAAEGMSPAGVNDVIRALAAVLKAYQEDVGGAPSAVATGNAYAVTSNSGVPASGYAAGMCFIVVPDTANTGAATINFDTRGSKKIRKFASGSEAALAANDLVANYPALIVYSTAADSAAGAFILLNPASSYYQPGGTDVAVADGGTGASTAAGARTNLGLVIGTDIQAYNAILAALAGLTLAQGDILYRNGTQLINLAAGTSGQVLKTQGASANPTWANAVTMASAQATTSGTAFDFTSIPAGVNRVSVNLTGVSLSGSDNILIQIGSSGGLETSGYVSSSAEVVSSSATSSTAGFVILSSNASTQLSGTLILSRASSSHLWTATGTFGDASTGGYTSGGQKTLSAALDRVRLTRTGTNTFDAGAVNILYE